jgi:hypothetical protein
LDYLYKRLNLAPVSYDGEWYRARRDAVADLLQETIRKKGKNIRWNGKGASASATETFPLRPPPPPPNRPRPPKNRYLPAYLAMGSMYSIPAGSTRLVQSVDEEIILEKIYIGDEPYTIYSLHSWAGKKYEPRVRMPDNPVVLRVRGTSMNKATPVPIEEGDYVLLKEQSDCGSMEIAAVTILEPNIPDSTLKRCYSHGTFIEFKPESTDPTHPSYSFEVGSGQFHVVGVALAVMKLFKKEYLLDILGEIDGVVKTLPPDDATGISACAKPIREFAEALKNGLDIPQFVQSLEALDRCLGSGNIRAETMKKLREPLTQLDEFVVSELKLEIIQPQRGEKFIPACHEAIDQVSTLEMDIAEDSIARVLRRGYREGGDGMIFAPAQVMVNTPKN